jgi:hypothetical protein
MPGGCPRVRRVGRFIEPGGYEGSKAIARRTRFAAHAALRWRGRGRLHTVRIPWRRQSADSRPGGPTRREWGHESRARPSGSDDRELLVVEVVAARIRVIDVMLREPTMPGVPLDGRSMFPIAIAGPLPRNWTS